MALMCWRRDMYDAYARREYSPEKRAMLERGEQCVEEYMDRHNCDFQEAVEGLAKERQAEFAELRATYAERHGFDDEQTLFALWAHGIDGTGSIQ